MDLNQQVALLKRRLALYQKSKPEFTQALHRLTDGYKQKVSELRTQLMAEREKMNGLQEKTAYLEKQVAFVKQDKVGNLERDFIINVKRNFQRQRTRLTDKEAVILGRIQLCDGLSIKQLAGYCQLKPTSAQYAINSLQMKGLIRTRKKGRERLCYLKKKVKATNETTNQSRNHYAENVISTKVGGGG